MKRLLMWGAAAVAVLMLPGGSLAASRTTNPGLAPVIVYVTETDKGTTYTMWQSIVEEGEPTLLVANALLRGEVVTFQVTNKGKHPHNFAAFGKKTKTLKPGGKAHFSIALIHRGKFSCRSTLDKGKPAFAGVLKVY